MLAALLLAASAAAHLSDCYYADRMETCGYVTVPENRRVKHSRHIDVHFVIVHAQHAGGVPIFFAAGGPGQSMIDVGRTVATIDLGAALRPDHDLVFVDQRGTGESNALTCRLYGTLPTPPQVLAALFPPQALRECRRRLSASADLSAYNTDEAADDMNAIRSALGYPRIALWGVSYGSEFTLDYIRRHGDTVQSAVVEDVAPPSLLLLPPFVPGGKAAIAHAALKFPDLPGDLALLKERGVPRMAPDLFANEILEALTDVRDAGMLAAVVHQAARGDAEPLRLYLYDLRVREIHDLSMGLHLSVVCAENMPFVTSRGNTLIGAWRRACAIWDVVPVSRAFIEPIRSTVPILMFSGADDPLTPPFEADAALRYLPNGKHVVIPDAAHDLDSPLVTKQGAAFINAH